MSKCIVEKMPILYDKDAESRMNQTYKIIRVDHNNAIAAKQLAEFIGTEVASKNGVVTGITWAINSETCEVYYKVDYAV